MNVITRGRDVYSTRDLIASAEAVGMPGRWYGNVCGQPGLEDLGVREGAECEEWQLRLLDGNGWHQIDNEGTSAEAIALAIATAIVDPARDLANDVLIAAFPHPQHDGEPAHVHCLVALGDLRETSDALNGRHLSRRY